MSAQRGVLAVMDRMTNRASFGRLRDGDVSAEQMQAENQDHLRAIAAVAELVDASKALRDDWYGVGAVRRFEAALARMDPQPGDQQ